MVLFLEELGEEEGGCGGEWAEGEDAGCYFEQHHGDN